jgi:hypothetical protein
MALSDEEILGHIFAYLAHPIPTRGVHTRSAWLAYAQDLRACSLVSSQVRSVAQALLWRNPQISDACSLALSQVRKVAQALLWRNPQVHNGHKLAVLARECEVSPQGLAVLIHSVRVVGFRGRNEPVDVSLIRLLRGLPTLRGLDLDTAGEFDVAALRFCPSASNTPFRKLE